MSAFKQSMERLFFGTTLDEVMDNIRGLSRRVDDISANIDREMAGMRTGIRALDKARAPDPRDGLYIVEDDCISCQVCTDIAPEIYRMRDDGIAEVYNPYGADMLKIQESVESCGGSCIKLT